MAVAKARLVSELTIQQLIQDLAAEWEDDENDVVNYLAELLTQDALRGRDSVRFHYRFPLETKRANGTVSYRAVELPLWGGVSAMAQGLRRMSRNALDWKDVEAHVYIDATHVWKENGKETSLFRQLIEVFPRMPQAATLFKVPLKEVYARKEQVITLLKGKDLPVPQDWTGSKPSGAGLTQSSRIKGGKQPKYNRALQDAINRIGKEVTAEGKIFNLSNLKDWLRENTQYEDPYSFEPPIPDCDELYVDGPKLVWKDREGRERDITLRSLERYIKRAKTSENS